MDTSKGISYTIAVILLFSTVTISSHAVTSLYISSLSVDTTDPRGVHASANLHNNTTNDTTAALAYVLTDTHGRSIDSITTDNKDIKPMGLTTYDVYLEKPITPGIYNVSVHVEGTGEPNSQISTRLYIIPWKFLTFLGILSILTLLIALKTYHKLMHRSIMTEQEKRIKEGIQTLKKRLRS